MLGQPNPVRERLLAASITLTGPGGTTALDGSTDHPMTIWRDDEGQVRALLRGELTLAYWATNGLTRSRFDILFSRGIPRRSLGDSPVP